VSSIRGHKLRLPIDILAVSKDGTCLLVVELKRGRASDVVVGQALRYIGYVQDELA
jgi:RecB family endonuclease NucS